MREVICVTVLILMFAGRQWRNEPWDGGWAHYALFEKKKYTYTTRLPDSHVSLAQRGRGTHRHHRHHHHTHHYHTHHSHHQYHRHQHGGTNDERGVSDLILENSESGFDITTFLFVKIFALSLPPLSNDVFDPEEFFPVASGKKNQRVYKGW